MPDCNGRAAIGTLRRRLHELQTTIEQGRLKSWVEAQDQLTQAEDAMRRQDLERARTHLEHVADIEYALVGDAEASAAALEALALPLDGYSFSSAAFTQSIPRRRRWTLIGDVAATCLIVVAAVAASGACLSGFVRGGRLDLLVAGLLFGRLALLEARAMRDDL